jgi:hypothetical protein
MERTTFAVLPIRDPVAIAGAVAAQDVATTAGPPVSDGERSGDLHERADRIDELDSLHPNSMASLTVVAVATESPACSRTRRVTSSVGR